MPARVPYPIGEASFVAYLHYLEDLAGVAGGRYGWAGSLVEGVYTALASTRRCGRWRRAGPAGTRRARCTRHWGSRGSGWR